MFKKENLELLRSRMKADGNRSYIVLASDPHLSEYVAPHYLAERLAFAPFTGSDGSLVVTPDGAYLFTDGRYFIQAERELEGSGVTLMKMGTKECPSIPDFLAEKDIFPAACNLFVTPQKLYAELRARGEIRDCDYSVLVSKPPLSGAEVFALEPELSSQSQEEKLTAVRREISARGADGLLIASLEDIAYLLNWRGSDMEYTPVFYAFLYVPATGIPVLFIDSDKLGAVDSSNLEIRAYDEISAYLQKLTGRVIVDSARVSAKLYGCLASPEEGPSPTYIMKAVKGSSEIANIKKIHELDGLAMLKFYDFLYTHRQESLSEYDYAVELERYRRQAKSCLGLSFETIAAVDANAALMHYGPTAADHSTVLPSSAVLLVDSGGQYLGGTTDITRTFLFGEPEAELRRDYTLTLKSLIDLSKAVFIEGASGRSLDALAREVMWKEGMDYKCGTGHGVGYMLGVHEGPNGFRYRQVPERDDGCTMVPGMVTTVEPGVYKEGRYGIRIENELLCVPAFHTDDGVFYRFETITYCPIETAWLDLELLSDEEIAYLNDYHASVYEKLSRHLTDNPRLLALLKLLTKPVVRP